MYFSLFYLNKSLNVLQTTKKKKDLPDLIVIPI